jgi:hypothetical protein
LACTKLWFKGYHNLRIPFTMLVTRSTTRNEMQRLGMPYLEAFVRMFLTGCATTRMLMHYGRTFVCSMRELRVSMKKLNSFEMKLMRLLMKYPHA